MTGGWVNSMGHEAFSRPTTCNWMSDRLVLHVTVVTLFGVVYICPLSIHFCFDTSQKPYSYQICIVCSVLWNYSVVVTNYLGHGLYQHITCIMTGSPFFDNKQQDTLVNNALGA